MRQPRDGRLPKRTFCFENLSPRSHLLFSVLSLLAVLPIKVSTQYTDEPFIVGPTPALRLNERDLTTVLLVNNDNERGEEVHGRFVNVRPEVGLLTSTARTFIQEGVTTEYATQVLGKSLRNGRIYAQLLKRSSRILYEPSVVTSWVGESAQTKSLLQSHNDLQNVEGTDWKDIDDRLLAKNDFVGNTDDLIAHESLITKKPVINTTTDATTSLLSSSSTLSSLSGSSQEAVRKQKANDDPGKIIAKKVLPLRDLPTYTVKNYFLPSRFSSKSNSADVSLIHNNDETFRSAEDKPRTPKLYYNKIMGIPERLRSEDVSSTTTKPLDSSYFSLSTITYYGFANFTTMVGDSVIVFSPSTLTSNSYNGHATSIKGEATLDGTNAKYASNVLTEDSIVPTLVQPSSMLQEKTTARDESTITGTHPAMTEYRSTVVGYEAMPTTENISAETSTKFSSSDKLETEDDANRQHTKVMIDATSVQDESFASSTRTLLSRPSDEDILRIYASLSSLEQAKQAAQTTSNSVNEVDTTAKESEDSTSSKLQANSGATTVFYEDDPFANYIEMSTIQKTNLEAAKTDSASKISSILTTTVPEISADISHQEDIETSTSVADEQLYSTVKQQFATVGKQDSTLFTPQLDTGSILPSIADEDDALCSRTSEVFLTQLPRVDTYFTTHLISEQKQHEPEHVFTSIETNIHPTYTIEETTKYYCLKSIEAVEIMKDAVNESVQVERPEGTGKNNNNDFIAIPSNVTRAVLETSVTMTSPLSDTQDVTEDFMDNSTSDYDNTEKNENEETVDAEAEDVEDEDEPEETSSGEEIDIIYKTLYTTYTYLTTFFQHDTTSISSRKEVITNVITSSLKPETITQTETNTNSESYQIAPTPKYVVPSLLESLLDFDNVKNSNNNPSLTDIESSGMESTMYVDDSKFTKTYYTTYTYYTTIFSDGETDVMSRTEVHTNHVTNTNGSSNSRDNSLKTVNNLSGNINASTTSSIYSQPLDQESVEVSDMKAGYRPSVTLVTGAVQSSSSNGGQQIISNSQFSNNAFEDQISSESNNDEIIPAATLLLQTSFTTFTYYTTVYSGDETNVLSRLETATNVGTETLLPTTTTAVEDIVKETVAMLPVTFFTTFTYWTKLSKEGDVTTLSREETVSNIVVPSNMHTDHIAMSISVPLQDNSAGYSTSLFSPQETQQEETPKTNNNSEDNTARIEQMTLNAGNATNKADDESTTFYTTFTYYTTSYIDDQTITDSRLETITNVVTPETIRSPSTQANRNTSDTVSLGKDNRGNVISEEQKKITDAEGISTLYYTTQVIATLDESGLATTVTSQFSSLYVDEDKKSQLSTINESVLSGKDSNDTISTRQYKTGLVRLIEGTRIGNYTTTLYQSKVIGTLIDNRYAQIIESTSSFLTGNPGDVLKSTESVAVQITATTVDQNRIQSTNKPSIESRTIPAFSSDLASSINDASMDFTTEEASESHEVQQQSKKSKFSNKVIRPFASGNRPQFAPKRKNPSAGIASAITRSYFTPTITATPALKQSSRFLSSSRRGGFHGGAISTAPDGLSSSRRLSRLYKKNTNQAFGGSTHPSSPFNSGRSSLHSSSITSSAYSRRSSVVHQTGSSTGGFRGLSNAYVGNFRSSRLKPTSTGGFAHRTTSTAVDNFSTSSYEDEDLTQENTNASGEEDATNARRSQNPLLRFRRPPFSRLQLTNGSGNNSSATSGRRYPFSRSAKSGSAASSTTTTTTQRPSSRSLQRPVPNYQSRPRPQSNLFPQRGLFQTQQQLDTDRKGKIDTKLKEESEENGDVDDDSDYEDDEEDGEYEADESNNNRRRRSNTILGKSILGDVKVGQQQSGPFIRSKREANRSQQIRNTNFRQRFRHLKPVAEEHRLQSEEKIDPSQSLASSATTNTNLRVGMKSRFIARQQTHSYNSHHLTTTKTTVPNNPTSNHRLIRPTRPTTSTRAQFTLRDKDTQTTPTKKSLSRAGSLSGFRRPKTSASVSSRRPSPSSSSGNRGRNGFKVYANSSNNAATESVFLRTSNGRTRDNKAATSRSRGSNIRGRNRNDVIAEPVLPAFDGTITVTHVIPAEVAIPVINGQVTEYKNIVTAKTSTEILGPQQYTTIIGSNGQASTALIREDTTVNFAGATELTQYVLHESSTTTVIFTPTSIRGRKTSFSHIIPSTVYSVENVVSTVHPKLSNANAPLANILLSHLLLGNIGLQGNPLLGALGDAVTQPTQGVGVSQQSPVTEFRTHTSTYVTTVVEGASTVLPVTFQGKKILTTIFDTSAQTITATEFITDTIVTTPSANYQSAQVNSLLLQHLLLQQQQQQQSQPIVQSKPLALSENLQDLDINNLRMSNDANDIDDLAVESNTHKSTRKKNRKLGKNNNNRHKKPATSHQESTVVTLYVSGRRPGDFSTVLSTVFLDSRAHSAVHHTANIDSLEDFYVSDGSEFVSEYVLPQNISPYELLDYDSERDNNYFQVNDNMLDLSKSTSEHTKSLESFVGDVSQWYAISADSSEKLMKSGTIATVFTTPTTKTF